MEVIISAISKTKTAIDDNIGHIIKRVIIRVMIRTDSINVGSYIKLKKKKNNHSLMSYYSARVTARSNFSFFFFSSIETADRHWLPVDQMYKYRGET